MKICLLGAGVMGKGIAQVFSAAGHEVALFASSEESAKKIALELKGFTLTLKGTKSFNDAQITKGGADVRQFDAHTMMSKTVANLYACGEILDVDGACGGFNLAWAFASGRLAGKNAATA